MKDCCKDSLDSTTKKNPLTKAHSSSYLGKREENIAHKLLWCPEQWEFYYSINMIDGNGIENN